MNHHTFMSKLLFTAYIFAVMALCFADSTPDSFTGSCINFINSSARAFPEVGNDKIIHLTMFFPFPVLAIGAFGKPNPKIPKFASLLVTVALAGILTGGMTEFLQGYLGYRDCDIKDFFADSIGILFGVAVTIQLFVLDRKRKLVVLSRYIPCPYKRRREDGHQSQIRLEVTSKQK